MLFNILNTVPTLANRYKLKPHSKHCQQKRQVKEREWILGNSEGRSQSYTIVLVNSDWADRFIIIVDFSKDKLHVNQNK
jgi:hypothetical protein